MTYRDPSSPAIQAAPLTKSDANVIDPPTKAIYVGGAGDVTVLMADDSTPVTFAGVQAGTLLPIRIQKLMSTGTAATSVLALY